MSSTECDHWNLLLTIVVGCVDIACDMMPKSNRQRASFFFEWRCPYFSMLPCVWPVNAMVRRPTKCRLPGRGCPASLICHLCYSYELRELLGLESVSLITKKGRLRWFGHVESKDDTVWVKRYIMTEVEGTKPRRCSGKTCWDGIKEYKK